MLGNVGSSGLYLHIIILHCVHSLQTFTLLFMFFPSRISQLSQRTCVNTDRYSTQLLSEYSLPLIKPQPLFVTKKTHLLSTESLWAKWKDDRGVAAAAATCSGPTLCCAHAPPGDRQPPGLHCVRSRPAARYLSTAAPTWAAACCSSPAALLTGRRWERPQVWSLRPWYISPGQPSWAPVHGEPRQILPVHTVYEDLQPGDRPAGASVCAGGAEAFCVWCV